MKENVTQDLLNQILDITEAPASRLHPSRKLIKLASIKRMVNSAMEREDICPEAHQQFMEDINGLMLTYTRQINS